MGLACRFAVLVGVRFSLGSDFAVESGSYGWVVFDLSAVPVDERSDYLKLLCVLLCVCLSWRCQAFVAVSVW